MYSLSRFVYCSVPYEGKFVDDELALARSCHAVRQETRCPTRGCHVSLQLPLAGVVIQVRLLCVNYALLGAGTQQGRNCYQAFLISPPVGSEGLRACPCRFAVKKEQMHCTERGSGMGTPQSKSRCDNLETNPYSCRELNACHLEPIPVTILTELSAQQATLKYITSNANIKISDYKGLGGFQNVNG